MTDDEFFRWRNSYHEAGHAAMSWFLGEETNIIFIEMTGTEKIHARVRYRNTYPVERILGAKDGTPNIARKLATAEVMCNLAGPAVENKILSEPDDEQDWLNSLWDETDDIEDYSPTSDLGKAVQIAKAFAGDSERHWRTFLDERAAWTDEAIRLPKFWDVIETLAQQLMKTDKITGPEANEIMSSSWIDDRAIPVLRCGQEWHRRIFGDCA